MSAENSPHHVIPTPAVLDMVYGHSDGDLARFLSEGTASYAKEFLSRKEDNWVGLMRDVFRDPRVRVEARPSQKLVGEMAAAERERTEEQRRRLGPEGLEEAGKRVAEAVASQRQPPNSVLEAFPVADVGGIIFRRLSSHNATSVGSRPAPGGFALGSVPFRMHLDDVDSQFVRYYLFLDTGGVAESDRPYLVLLTELWLQSPLIVRGRRMDLAEVIRRRSEQVLTFYNDLGYKGSTFSPGGQSDNMMFYCESLMVRAMPYQTVFSTLSFRALVLH